MLFKKDKMLQTTHSLSPNVPLWWGRWLTGRLRTHGGKEARRKSLHLPLNSAVNLKLLVKKNSPTTKQTKNNPSKVRGAGIPLMRKTSRSGDAVCRNKHSNSLSWDLIFSRVSGAIALPVMFVCFIKRGRKKYLMCVIKTRRQNRNPLGHAPSPCRRCLGLN